MAGLRALAFWLLFVTVLVVPAGVVMWFVVKLVRILMRHK